MLYTMDSGYGRSSQALPFTTGKIFMVADSTVVGYQRLQDLWQNDPDGVRRLYSTIQDAVDNAEEGTLILVAPGHVTTITAAGGLSLDKEGIKIVGLGEGGERPSILFTTSTAADINVEEDNITLQNFQIDLTGIDALAAPIDVNAAGFRFLNNDVTVADATGQATLAILTDANASGLNVEGNTFLGSANAGTATVVRLVGGTKHVIRNNLFSGNYTTTLGAIENNTTACTDVLIEDNVIRNNTASAAKAMVFEAGSTGTIRRNNMQILTGSAPITGAGMSWVGQNYYAATIATAGTLI